MNLAASSYITLGAPLAGCLVLALGGMRIPTRIAGWLGSLAILVAFAGAISAFASGGHTGAAALLTPWQWLDAGSFHIGFDLYVDRLANSMMLVVTGVGFLIHVYSIGYMDGDPQFRRFFAYLNIFVFAMLLLVMGGNLVMLLAGWGLVGMASYLLIGFWHDRPTAVAAAKKAFIINALGDVSLMIGLFLTFQKTGVLDYVALPGAAGSLSTGTLTAISLLLLGGAITKSAQLPVHTWLPDAMEGPTPVSALIHAATMVTAGVYLVARFEPYLFTHTSLAVTAVIGALTLTVAGFIALVQTDIKRVIAYSTMSQIGYMFVGVGVGASGAAMFHLMTHAFFKALLFLAAGIVIHALADEQDIRKMGGLKKYMPKTYTLFLVASLALAGIFPFAGFFSKDEILGAAFRENWSAGHSAAGWAVVHWGVWGLGITGALLTGIYSFRLVYLVFHGEESELVRQYGAGELAHGHGDERAEPAAAVTPATHPAPSRQREAPATMFYPVAVLGVLAAVGGFLVVPGGWNVIGRVLDPEKYNAIKALGAHAELTSGKEWALALLISMPMGLIGIGIATTVWKSGVRSGWRARAPRLKRVFENAFYFDALYHNIFARPARGIAQLNTDIIEGELVGPGMVAAERTVLGFAGLISAAQNGLVRLYAFATVVAVAAVVIAVLWLEG